MAYALSGCLVSTAMTAIRLELPTAAEDFDNRSATLQDIKKPDCQALPILGINLSATPLLHQRFPVGCGPSLKTWPWWPPQRAQ